MAMWPAKDPDAVLDYVYRIPLDAGDSVASHSLISISGTATIDSENIATTPDTVDGQLGQAVTAWIRGGAHGETNVFRIAWTTTLSRHDDDIITLPIFESDIAPLLLTGYAKPISGHLLARYPAFADVSPSTIAFWLTDAERYVTQAWSEGDYAAGLMALAAHNMALAGYGTGGTLAEIPRGVSRFKSGTLDVTLTDAAANGSGYDSTIYGAEYQMLLRRNRAGPFVAPTGIVLDGILYPSDIRL